MWKINSVNHSTKKAKHCSKNNDNKLAITSSDIWIYFNIIAIIQAKDVWITLVLVEENGMTALAENVQEHTTPAPCLSLENPYARTPSDFLDPLSWDDFLETNI